MKNFVLILALICSVIYMTLFWINNEKANRIANKIQKPFVLTSFVLLIIYIIL